MYKCSPVVLTPPKQVSALIGFRFNTTLRKPSLYSAHQTLQKQMRFHQGGPGPGLAASSPRLTFPMWKTRHHSAAAGETPSPVFLPVRLRNGDTAHPLTPSSYENGAGLW